MRTALAFARRWYAINRRRGQSDYVCTQTDPDCSGYPNREHLIILIPEEAALSDNRSHEVP